MITIEEALAWIADLFEEPKENIKPETLRQDIPTWDSLGILTLMAKLDEDYDIILSEEELQNLRTVDDILSVMRRNGKLK
ncbi:MAG: acyl carrier protein [bacterium]